MSFPDWICTKGYIHMDMPIKTKEEKLFVCRYVTNANSIKKHAFLPLIRRRMYSYPYKDFTGNDGKEKRRIKKKLRNITFASHLDASIMGYYSRILGKNYEKYLKDNGLTDEVAAYRKIKKSDGKGNKCNIDIAYEVFQKIKEYVANNDSVGVITFDIKGFFDNLDHKIIKNTWKKIMGFDVMPGDVYNVYKNIVKYSFIYETELFEHYKNNLISANGSRKRCKSIRYLRDKNIVAYCSKEEINIIRDKGLIRQRKKNENVGIPQGLLISAILANVYMSEFDVAVKHVINKINGIYRRYSDDIIVVCPEAELENCKSFIINEISNVNLEIETHKTNSFVFRKKGSENIECVHIEHDGSESTSKKLVYLGFSFDGNDVLLKDACVGKFYNKMHKWIDRGVYYGIHINNKTVGRMFEYKLIKKFTFAGAKTHIKRLRNSEGLFKETGERTYGNFLTYVNKSAAVMDSGKIIRQLRRCTNKLKNGIENGKTRIGKGLYAIAINQISKYGRIYK